MSEFAGRIRPAALRMDAPRVLKRPAGMSPPPWDTPSSSLGSVRGSILSPQNLLLEEEDRGNSKPKKRKLHSEKGKLCPWENCGKIVTKNDDVLFDHIVKEHIVSLKGVDQKEKEQNNNRKEKEDSDSDDESEADPYSCRWPNCGMSLKRGDEERKIEWLEVHLHSRHIANARRFRCGKCKFRGKTKKMADEHEKKCGKTEKKKKREPRASPLLFYHPADPRPPQPRKRTRPPVRPADCFQYVYVRPPKLHPLLADFDPEVDAHFKRTITFKIKHNWNVRREFNPTWKDAVGSKWRKMRLPGEAYRFVVIDIEKEEQEKEERDRLREEAEIPYDTLPRSLDELYPPPLGYPSHKQLSSMGRKRAEHLYRSSLDFHSTIVRPPSTEAATLPARPSASASADAYGSVPYSPASLGSAQFTEHPLMTKTH
ncbi:hypothetical protein PMAYCL1PPCAC_07940 [Pristionchus mayeri]|uniref:C2H2-type domain-containing protein n=1 Tax=Pristionchus mayeri TaxID=1317129 RepID=A0AAN5CB93_9BILA|nr:hypothetical protein PMAYCL1PPCAC_07940 [Pristionchus mayeri]